MSWLFDAFGSGFQHPTDPARLQLFRIVYGTVLTLRFTLSLGQGGWAFMSPGSVHLDIIEQRDGRRWARFMAAVYRPALIIRTGAALGLAAGLLPRVALVLVLAGLSMELRYLKSANAVRYALLTGGALLTAGNLGHGFRLDHTPNTANCWAQVLLVLITTHVYWGSAWQKIRSPQFRRGLYLAQWVHTYAELRPRLPYRWQYAIPGPVYRTIGGYTNRDVLVWRTVAATVIAGEIVLPPALLIPQTTPYAITAGILMHGAFTCLKPFQLITFSGLTVGTYLAFLA